MKKKTAKKAAPKKSATGAGNGKFTKKYDGKSVDALDLLKADHTHVKAIFKKYQTLVDNGGSKREKMALVKDACNALAVHAQIEEEIFYPALQGAAENSELAEAFVEHDCAKDLIGQLEQMSDDQAIFDAKFVVLGEQVKHHIDEEEEELFSKARKAKLDLQALGMQMLARKEELEREPSFPDRPIPREEAPAYVQ